MSQFTDGGRVARFTRDSWTNHECSSGQPERRVRGRQRRQRGGLGTDAPIMGLCFVRTAAWRRRGFKTDGRIQLYAKWERPFASATKRGRNFTAERAAAIRWMMSSAPRSPRKRSWKSANGTDHAQLTRVPYASKGDAWTPLLSGPERINLPTESGSSALRGAVFGQRRADNPMSKVQDSGTSEWSSEQTDRRYANCVQCGCIDSIHRAAGGFCAECYAEVRGEQR